MNFFNIEPQHFQALPITKPLEREKRERREREGEAEKKRIDLRSRSREREREREIEVKNWCVPSFLRKEAKGLVGHAYTILCLEGGVGGGVSRSSFDLRAGEGDV